MSSIQQLAVHLLRQCSGHLLATVLMARALKDVKNVRIWQHASRVIGCLPTSHAEDRILFNALAFVLGHLDGRGLMEAPKNETWEEANEMYLMNNKISKLLDNPNCPKLAHCSYKLPAEVGEFCHLEVLDLEGTEIINLPVAIGKLTNLTCLKVSFYPQANGNRKNNPSNRIIPQNVISSLLQLEELSIDVNPEDERWNATIKDIIYCWQSSKRIISRLPHESAIKFEEQESCLKYVNGKDIPIEIKEELVVEDCPEINTIMLPADQQNWRKRYLPNLKKISLHYLPKLVSIFGNVPIAPSLEWLSFYDCPSLKILFRRKDIDLRTQLAEINDQLQAQMQGTKPSQQSGLDDFLENPAVESKQAQSRSKLLSSKKKKGLIHGYLFMKWPLSELHRFLIQAP
ncbi:hypothetical protein CK203_095855 [Vitis vinifera]|uniref:Disease resistance protein n=1 Tax=Vitis vinifera TaxID=29760 RepID=A0A438C7L2_VITVI|nr:hypothetical protein CK203_095855 [Vitis vinifera]